MDVSMPPKFDHWIIAREGPDGALHIMNIPYDGSKDISFHHVDTGIMQGTLIHGENLARYWLLQVKLCFPKAKIYAFFAEAFLDFHRGKMKYDELKANFQIMEWNYLEVIEDIRQYRYMQEANRQTQDSQEEGYEKVVQ